jgi:type III restriction enzyme
MAGGIDHLIIGSPFEEPASYWAYERETRRFERRTGRRSAGYVVATPGVDSFDDPGIFVELPLVNRIRPRVQAWRETGYPGVTGTTKRLLAHWRDTELREGHRFFFCQLEAIETLIWLTEAPAADRRGIDVPGDGGPFPRVCAKMATGTGKTIVMAMVIAWQVLNKVADPQDKRFARHVFVVAPGLTVRKRLEVLEPSHPESYYDAFDIVPSGLRDRLRHGKVRVRNWHALAWETEERLKRRRSVDKRGAKSDEAYVREVLGELASAKNLLVLNDEAHHAWRVPTGSKIAGVAKAEVEEATQWVGGLDRIHRTRGILGAYDFSATPFAPSGKRNQDEALFEWIVSDFGLSDAIEAGLVKTPRVVVRDDGVPEAKQYRSKLFHIYPHVSGDLNRPAEAHEPLPQLVANAYYLIGKDWLETAREWEKAGAATPPVMITVANRTETAARIAYAFEHQRILIPELCDPDRVLHIDSKVLEMAEAREETAAAEAAPEVEAEGDDEAPIRKLTKQQQAEALRQKVDTVGQVGKPGAMIQNVISVGMLSEGWDAKTVTHIMGLRAFSSQLLCEQVVGRGLRRTSYETDPETGFFRAEFVNIFGVPFTFLPHEGGEETPPPPPKPRTRIEPVLQKQGFEITWPNVVRIDQVYGHRLALDFDKVSLLKLAAHETLMLAELAPTVDGKPDVTRVDQITLEELGRKSRMQTIVFRAAAEVFDQMKPGWPGTREALLGQLVGLVERFLGSDRIAISPNLYAADLLRRRIMLTLSMGRIVQHLFGHIRSESTVARRLVLDRERPIRATGDMLPWWTSRRCGDARRSHVNFCVYDSAWEANEAFAIDRHPEVAAWVKNDHLGFEVHYVFQGAVRKYRPDFLVRMIDGPTLILEVKGQDTSQDQTKREFLAEWAEAVSEQGGFGRFVWDVSHTPSDIADILAKHAGSPA